MNGNVTVNKLEVIRFIKNLLQIASKELNSFAKRVRLNKSVSFFSFKVKWKTMYYSTSIFNFLINIIFKYYFKKGINLISKSLN